MLLEALSTARDLGRLHEIASVLVRHGLGDAVRRLGVAGVLERAGRALHWRGAEGLATKEPQVRMREALEQLGPTFVKVGQLLADRTDLLPPAWTEELSRLRERAAPVPWDELRAQLAEDLGAPPEEVFRDLDPEPLAAASIAQVHRARLADGTRVALKVRRPGVREVVEADLRLLARLAERAEAEMPELRRYRPRALVRQMARSLRGEVDLRAEAKNAARIRATLPAAGRVMAPRVFTEWTSERLCVLELLEGPSVGAWARAGRPDGVDAPALARAGADAVLELVFVHGFFHADPHPGNVLVLPDGRLGLLDFGMVGHFGDERRLELLELLVGFVERREEAVAEVLLAWAGDRSVDVPAFVQDCAAFIDRYHGATLRQIDVTELLGDLTALLRENQLFLPADVAMLLKLFVTLEGLGRLLDPEFVMAARLEPFVERAWREEHAPLALMRRGLRDVSAITRRLPRDLRRLTIAARRGRLGVEIEVRRLEEFGRTIDRSTNRLTVGMVTAALIVGTAIASTVPGGDGLLGRPLLLLGFASSIVAGLWLLWSIRRASRR